MRKYPSEILHMDSQTFREKLTVDRLFIRQLHTGKMLSTKVRDCPFGLCLYSTNRGLRSTSDVLRFTITKRAIHFYEVQCHRVK